MMEQVECHQVQVGLNGRGKTRFAMCRTWALDIGRKQFCDLNSSG